MRAVFSIYKKEWRSYLNSPMGYIYLIVFLIIANWLFLRGFFLISQASMRGFFSIIPWLFLLFVPAVSMRLWAEERKLKTLEVLFTLPIRDQDALLGKYFAALTFIALSLALTLPLPIVISLLGNLDWGEVVGGYLGALFLGATFLAIGSFASSLTDNQIVAFIVGALISFGLLILSQDIVLYSMPPKIAPILQYLGLDYHYEGLARGVIDSRDILYYLSVIVLFLYFNLRVLEVKR